MAYRRDATPLFDDTAAELERIISEDPDVQLRRRGFTQGPDATPEAVRAAHLLSHVSFARESWESGGHAQALFTMFNIGRKLEGLNLDRAFVGKLMLADFEARDQRALARSIKAELNANKRRQLLDDFGSEYQTAPSVIEACRRIAEDYATGKETDELEDADDKGIGELREEIIERIARRLMRRLQRIKPEYENLLKTKKNT